MSRSDRRRSRSPRRPRRSRSPAQRRYRSPADRSLSPGRRRRGSPDYSRYTQEESRTRPIWIDADMSEDDLREEAGGDGMEFRRLKRLKLNERNIRPFWKNSPTPTPSPEHKLRPHRPDPAALLATETPIDGQANGIEAAGAAAASRPSSLLREQVLAAGGEVAELHLKAAELFKAWLADEKAAAAEAEKRRKQQEADDVIVGPVLEATEKAAVDYGTHMRPGEGTAMAAYVQSGKRIPRRGEVGMSADQISSYEDLGYVMSGSRHNRMNAIRIRKENQVYTAEEKAALAMFNMEENKRKEQKILSDMQRLVQKTLGETDEASDPEAEAAPEIEA